MSVIKMIAAVAFAVPAIALAQVGPNPSVNGSLDPTVGSSNDTATAPDDSAVGRDATTMNSSAPATTGDPSSNMSSDAPTEAKRSTAPTSETRHKPR